MTMQLQVHDHAIAYTCTSKQHPVPRRAIHNSSLAEKLLGSPRLSTFFVRKKPNYFAKHTFICNFANGKARNPSAEGAFHILLVKTEKHLLLFRVKPKSLGNCLE